MIVRLSAYREDEEPFRIDRLRGTGSVWKNQSLEGQMQRGIAGRELLTPAGVSFATHLSA
jgi:hypothetical protein